MFKRYVAFLTTVIFIITMFPIAFSKRVYAYKSNAYFNNVKVGLVSMSSANITLTLIGEYTLNGQVYPSGSVINLGVNGTSITLNGILQSQITLNPNNSSNLLIITSGIVSNKYMGSFLLKFNENKILVINMLDIENYLKGVVGYELSDSCPLESLKAQAVAARNYALSRVGYASAKGYDFDDTPAYQTYKGYDSSLVNVISAVDQTRGQALLYNDTLVETLYSAWHGGVSENSENVWGNNVPYLKSVQDPFESLTWPNGNITLTNIQIQAILTTKGYLVTTDTFLSLDLNSITKFASGRVSNINFLYKDVTGTTKTKAVTLDSTRTFLSLPSNLYTVTYDALKAAYTFAGKGNGHGLGMSQIGAKNRAAAGQTYEQILKFYYQNVYLQNIILKATLSSLTQTTNSLYLGNTISFNTTAAAGNGYGYLFKYVVKNGTNSVFTSDYSSNSSLDFVPTSPGNYTVQAYTKDKYSVSEHDDTKISSFTVYGNLLLNSFTLSNTNTKVGQAVSTNIDVQSGSGSFLYKYEVSKDGIILETRDFLTDKQFTYTPIQSGNYTITAYVKDAISIKSYDFMQKQNFTAFNALTLSSFTKDNQNIFLGDTVNFIAQVSGGSGEGANYKFVVTKDNISIVTQDFGSSNTLAFTSTQQGIYDVAVYVKDALSDQTYDDVNYLTCTVSEDAKVNTVLTNKSQYLTGQTVNLNVTTLLTSGISLYKYVVSMDGVILYTTDYSTNASLQYLVNNAGTYIITIYVKDTLSTKPYSDMKTLNIPVYSQPTMTYVSTKGSAIVLNAVDYSIKEINGGGNAQYRFVVMKDSKLVSDSGYSNTNSFTLTPATSGTYKVTGYLKDALSENSFDTQNTLSLIVYNPQLAAVSASGYFYEGKPVTFNSNSTGASPSSFSYRYEVYSNSNLVASNLYGISNTFTFTPNTAGVYIVKVYGKDGISTNAYDSIKQFNITINNKPLNISTLPLSLGMSNNDVVSLQTALIKLGYSVSSATGYFGSQTNAAVISFQNIIGIPGSGIVGDWTYNSMNNALIIKSGIKNLIF